MQAILINFPLLYNINPSEYSSTRPINTESFFLCQLAHILQIIFLIQKKDFEFMVF